MGLEADGWSAVVRLQVQKKKPDPQIYNMAREKVGMDADKCVPCSPPLPIPSFLRRRFRAFLSQQLAGSVDAHWLAQDDM